MSHTNLTDPGTTRVAFFIPAPNYGGAQRVTINIANGLAERGYDVDLVVAYAGGETADEIADAVRVVELEVPVVPGIGILAGVPQLRSYLQSARPDVLFAAQTHANIAAVLAARSVSGPPYVAVTEHLAYEHTTDLKGRATKRLAASVYRLADDVVAVSEGVAESVVQNTGVSSDGTTVLYNPIDVAEIQATATEPVGHEWFTDPALSPIVSVSRLEPQKDLSTLLRAFEQVYRARPETRLVVVGKGSEHERLVALAESLGIADVVSFPGYVDNPYAYMRAASVYAMSSQAEGLPTVLIEALACGASIVATDCPYGPREILDGGRYGRLTPVGDAAALADGLLAALADPIPPERSRERAAAFSMAAGIDRYEAYVRDVVSQKGLETRAGRELGPRRVRG